jgi:hypothetical protein
MLDKYLLVGVLVVCVAGLSVAVWSFVATRRYYFEEYKERKRNGKS